MKLFIYLISSFSSENSLVQFIKKFRKDNKLRACLFASEKLPFRNYNFLVSLDKIDFSSDSPKIFSSDNFRPYSIFIVKEKRLDFKIKPPIPGEKIIDESKVEFYSDIKFSDEMNRSFGGIVWLNRMDELIDLILDDSEFWKL